MTVKITDTTMRDGHQSLPATRTRFPVVTLRNEGSVPVNGRTSNVRRDSVRGASFQLRPAIAVPDSS